jgi:hypothetical protein
MRLIPKDNGSSTRDFKTKEIIFPDKGSIINIYPSSETSIFKLFGYNLYFHYQRAVPMKIIYSN